MTRGDGTKHDDTDPALSVVRDLHRDTLTIALTGELTGADAGLDLLGEWWHSGVRHVLVDVAGLSFVDVGGLRTLLGLHGTCAGRGVTLALHRVPHHLAWLLHITETGPLLAPRSPPPEPGPARRPGGAADEDWARSLRDRELIADERDRLLDERSEELQAHREWQDIREDLADRREIDLERREQRLDSDERRRPDGR